MDLSIYVQEQQQQQKDRTFSVYVKEAVILC